MVYNCAGSVTAHSTDDSCGLALRRYALLGRRPLFERERSLNDSTQLVTMLDLLCSPIQFGAVLIHIDTFIFPARLIRGKGHQVAFQGIPRAGQR